MIKEKPYIAMACPGARYKKFAVYIPPDHIYKVMRDNPRRAHYNENNYLVGYFTTNQISKRFGKRKVNFSDTSRFCDICLVIKQIEDAQQIRK